MEMSWEQLDLEDGMSLADLARGARMAPQSIGELVDQLEDLGMVERMPDPEDRRAKRVYLTDLAKEAQQAAREAVAASEARIKAVLGANRLAQLKRDLELVIEEFAGTVPEVPPQFQ